MTWKLWRSSWTELSRHCDWLTFCLSLPHYSLYRSRHHHKLVFYMWGPRSSLPHPLLRHHDTAQQQQCRVAQIDSGKQHNVISPYQKPQISSSPFHVRCTSCYCRITLIKSFIASLSSSLSPSFLVISWTLYQWVHRYCYHQAQHPHFHPYHCLIVIVDVCIGYPCSIMIERQ